MKRVSNILIAVVFTLCGAQAMAQDTFVSLATGGQETPPVRTIAFSLTRLSFTTQDTLLVGARLNVGHDQTVQNVHIHAGAVGESGAPILNLRLTTGAPGICVDLLGGLLTYYVLSSANLTGALDGMTLTDLRTQMSTGDTYINLHTPEKPMGWIRGQMMPVLAPGS